MAECSATARSTTNRSTTSRPTATRTDGDRAGRGTAARQASAPAPRAALSTSTTSGATSDPRQLGARLRTASRGARAAGTAVQPTQLLDKTTVSDISLIHRLSFPGGIMNHDDMGRTVAIPEPPRRDEGRLAVAARAATATLTTSSGLPRCAICADGPPFGGPGWGGGPFGGGRGRRRRGDVRTAMLMLLAEEPRNGYQLMQTIEERSGGRWRPSPGSVYPTLAQLEDEGLIRGDRARRHQAVRAHRRWTRAGRAVRQARPLPGRRTRRRTAARYPRSRSLIIQIGKAAWQVAQEGDERQVEKACRDAGRDPPGAVRDPRRGHKRRRGRGRRPRNVYERHDGRERHQRHS